MSKFTKLYNLVLNAIPDDNEEALAALEDLLAEVKQEGYEDGWQAHSDSDEYNEEPQPLDFSK